MFGGQARVFCSQRTQEIRLSAGGREGWDGMVSAGDGGWMSGVETGAEACDFQGDRKLRDFTGLVSSACQWPACVSLPRVKGDASHVMPPSHGRRLPSLLGHHPALRRERPASFTISGAQSVPFLAISLPPIAPHGLDTPPLGLPKG